MIPDTSIVDGIVLYIFWELVNSFSRCLQTFFLGSISITRLIVHKKYLKLSRITAENTVNFVDLEIAFLSRFEPCIPTIMGIYLSRFSIVFLHFVRHPFPFISSQLFSFILFPVLFFPVWFFSLFYFKVSSWKTRFSRLRRFSTRVLSLSISWFP